MSKRALVVIDLQNDYFPGGKWTLDRIDAAAHNAARLIAAARADGDLIVHVRHEFPTNDAPFFAPGSTGAEIHKAVRPAEGEAVVLKNQVNAFRDTNLKTVLDGQGIEDVTIIGAMSHMCVDAATRAASDFGYAVTVVHDACASRDLSFNDTTIPAAQVHAAYMAALGFAYATVVTTDSFLETRASAA